MSVITFQITSISIAYLSVCAGTDQTKHQSSASLAFVRGIHRRPVNSPHKGPVTRKMFPFDDVIMKLSFDNVGSGIISWSHVQPWGNIVAHLWIRGLTCNVNSQNWLNCSGRMMSVNVWKKRPRSERNNVVRALLTSLGWAINCDLSRMSINGLFY